MTEHIMANGMTVPLIKFVLFINQKLVDSTSFFSFQENISHFFCAQVLIFFYFGGILKKNV